MNHRAVRRAHPRCPTTTRPPTAARFSTNRSRDHIVFSDHSLATDSVFAEVQLVSCRNVLIYFNRALQDRALGLFHESLCRNGFLGIGSKESLRFSAHDGAFQDSFARTASTRSEVPRERHARRDCGATDRCGSCIGASAGGVEALVRAAAGAAGDCARAGFRRAASSARSAEPAGGDVSPQMRARGARGAGQGAGGAGNRILRVRRTTTCWWMRGRSWRYPPTIWCTIRALRSTCCSNRRPMSMARGCSASFLRGPTKTARQASQRCTMPEESPWCRNPRRLRSPLMVLSALDRRPPDLVLPLERDRRSFSDRRHRFTCADGLTSWIGACRDQMPAGG